MALQKTKFTWNVDNGFRIELNLTELSVSAYDNTSRILYNLVIGAGYTPLIECNVTHSISFNGVIVSSGTKAFSLPMSYGAELVTDKITTVTHNSDGSLYMPIVVSIKTDDPFHMLPDTTVNCGWKLINSKGSVRINNGATCEPHTAYLHNGTNFEPYTAYIYDGTRWTIQT